METMMPDPKPNEASLRANDPVDRLDLPADLVDADPTSGPDAKPAPTPANTRSEGAEMAPEIDEVDGAESGPEDGAEDGRA